MRGALFEHWTVSDPIRGSPPLTMWTYRRTIGMLIHMKTTLSIDDTVMAQLKREAARQGRTMSELVETGLRLLFQTRKPAGELPGLPRMRSGGTMVDVADREALYQSMDGR